MAHEKQPGFTKARNDTLETALQQVIKIVEQGGGRGVLVVIDWDDSHTAVGGMVADAHFPQALEDLVRQGPEAVRIWAENVVNGNARVGTINLKPETH